MGEEFDRMADLAAPFVTGPIPPEFGGDEDDEWYEEIPECEGCDMPETNCCCG